MANRVAVKKLSDEENPVLAVRQALGLTQEDMARECGASVMTERKWEYECRTPKNTLVRANFLRLAKKAGFEVAE